MLSTIDIGPYETEFNQHHLSYVNNLITDNRDLLIDNKLSTHDIQQVLSDLNIDNTLHLLDYINNDKSNNNNIFDLTKSLILDDNIDDNDIDYDNLIQLDDNNIITDEYSNHEQHIDIDDNLDNINDVDNDFLLNTQQSLQQLSVSPVKQIKNNHNVYKTPIESYKDSQELIDVSIMQPQLHNNNNDTAIIHNNIDDIDNNNIIDNSFNVDNNNNNDFIPPSMPLRKSLQNYKPKVQFNDSCIDIDENDMLSTKTKQINHNTTQEDWSIWATQRPNSNVDAVNIANTRKRTQPAIVEPVVNKKPTRVTRTRTKKLPLNAHNNTLKLTTYKSNDVPVSLSPVINSKATTRLR